MFLQSEQRLVVGQLPAGAALHVDDLRRRRKHLDSGWPPDSLQSPQVGPTTRHTER